MTNLSQVEKIIVELRCNGKSIFDLTEEDKKIFASEVIVTGASIAGCAMPNTEFFLDRLVKEVITFLIQFGYKELTEDEIFFAIRLNSNTQLKLPAGIEVEKISFFGSVFNVDYLSMVLSNYMTIRNLLDSKVRNKLRGVPE